MKNLVAFIRKRIGFMALLGIVFAGGGWIATVEYGLAANEKDIISNNQIISKQHDLQEQQAQLLEKISGQFELVLQLIGITVTDSIMKQWCAMPQSLPIDSFKNPIIGKEWLCVTADYLYGRIMKWTDGDTVLVMIAWDKRKTN